MACLVLNISEPPVCDAVLYCLRNGLLHVFSFSARKQLHIDSLVFGVLVPADSQLGDSILHLPFLDTCVLRNSSSRTECPPSNWNCRSNLYRPSQRSLTDDAVVHT